MNKELILLKLSAACPWQDTLHLYNTLESTNTLAKELAKAGELFVLCVKLAAVEKLLAE